MEAANARQHRPLHRCDSQPSPDNVGVDAGRGAHRLYKVQSARE
jgi:hypothetical protein